MAAKVVTLQKADGYWPASLLDDDPGTPPESSGTAFFTYAFAWGVDSGLLDRTTYEPAAVRGWGALGRAVQPDGMRLEEHTSELQSLMRNSYAVFCLKKKKIITTTHDDPTYHHTYSTYNQHHTNIHT